MPERYELVSNNSGPTLLSFPMIPLLHLVVSWALIGLIWTIQLVHYPSFRYVSDFTAFHQHHTSSITLVVGPLMLAEMALAAWLAIEHNWNWQHLVPFFVVITIWLLTFFWAVPLHEKLTNAKDNALIDQLLLANWPRTILWTIKGIWVFYFLGLTK